MTVVGFIVSPSRKARSRRAFRQGGRAGKEGKELGGGSPEERKRAARPRAMEPAWPRAAEEAQAEARHAEGAVDQVVEVSLEVVQDRLLLVPGERPTAHCRIELLLGVGQEG